MPAPLHTLAPNGKLLEEGTLGGLRYEIHERRTLGGSLMLHLGYIEIPPHRQARTTYDPATGVHTPPPCPEVLHGCVYGESRNPSASLGLLKAGLLRHTIPKT